MITLSLQCWLWARKRLVRPGPACVQPSWGAFVRADLPREVVGRALGGREPAKMLLLSPTYRRDVVEGASSPSVGLWLPVERLATWSGSDKVPESLVNRVWSVHSCCEV